jgi:hypothetical protein
MPAPTVCTRCSGTTCNTLRIAECNERALSCRRPHSQFLPDQERLPLWRNDALPCRHAIKVEMDPEDGRSYSITDLQQTTSRMHARSLRVIRTQGTPKLRGEVLTQWSRLDEFIVSVASTSYIRLDIHNASGEIARKTVLLPAINCTRNA